LAGERAGYVVAMHPRLWRLLISGSLRLFLSLTAVEHGVLLVGLLAVGISMLVPAPRPRHSEKP